MIEGADTYFDPDDVGPHDSPILKAMHIKLEPSPSPEAKPPHPISPISSPGGRKGGRRPNNRACQADAVLVSLMGGGKRPDIARNAGDEALPSDEDEYEESPIRGTAVEIPAHVFSSARADLDTMKMAADACAILGAHEDRSALRSWDNSQSATGEAPAVSKLLATTNANSQAQNTKDTPKCNPPTHAPYQKATAEVGIRAETQSSPSTGELPPIRHSPKLGLSNGNGNQQITLPSISAQLGDLNKLAEAASTPNEVSFSQSPGRPASRYASGPGATSPANSPNDTRRGMMSPSRPPQFYFVSSDPRRSSQPEGPHYIAAGDYSSSSNTETPSTDQSGSTPATVVIDRMSIDGITNPQVGGFQCTNPGCKAIPFQTQYLLNSHANVHSSNRPHYCLVEGCSRAEGGKGFKRKNEMIRHGLVHDSPGYICPFCPEREHRYPRPDNLQRHVRAHHTDKDKDDPQLREVLAQRPEGPSRGRRRRGGSR
ncbi:hypothetical protein SBOR_2012 [Sclerotinia borealis F-4128]|uniref:C2H2-type domain-containing protein n=1 Tax=Sclerotinia borealis (strain F-4128) TaxID=1432307 RepID=W9CP24_SCLBF|nr:hypothetical protein SBOR_2012 [Sclerotinia borealis F-4128]